MKWQWLNNLGTDYQFALAMGVLMEASWIASAFNGKLHDSIGVIVGGLGSLALGALGHGAYVRGKNPGSDKDLIGDVK